MLGKVLSIFLYSKGKRKQTQGVCRGIFLFFTSRRTLAQLCFCEHSKKMSQETEVVRHLLSLILYNPPSPL